MREKLAILCNLLIAAMTVFGCLQMTFFPVDGLLSVSGLSNLKFFTVLSNIFNGIVAAIYVYWVISGKPLKGWRATLKLMANSAVGLTFVTVMAMLGPLYGFSNMFNGSNLWFHLVLPMASWISFVLFEENSLIPFRQTLWTMVPTALYSAGYLCNIAVNGIGEGTQRNDFYGFLLWGNEVGAVIVVVMLLATWGIALGLRQLRRMFS